MNIISVYNLNLIFLVFKIIHIFPIIKSKVYKEIEDRRLDII